MCECYTRNMPKELWEQREGAAWKPKSVKSKNDVKAMTYFALGSLVSLYKCAFFSYKRKGKEIGCFNIQKLSKGVTLNYENLCLTHLLKL